MEANRFDYLLKRVELRLDILINEFSLKSLLLAAKACLQLEEQTINDGLVVSSVKVKAMILDDLRMIQKNYEVIKAAIKLKDTYNFESLHLN